MGCTPGERDQVKRFAAVYERAMTPAMKAIERRVCGCDYGGNSWLSRAQADDLGARLGLRPDLRLLDLGAGSGWPAVYLASTFGVRAMLIDLPEIGLRLAKQRAAADGIAERIDTLVADAANLPFAADSFDAVSHCDLLCCLVHKSAVLAQCRRVLRAGGTMAFTVISIAPGLSAADRRRAIASSPEFVEADTDYQTLLGDTGWQAITRTDITADYEAACRRQIKADQENHDRLAALIGRDEVAERLAGWRDKLATIRARLVVRELFVAMP